MAIPSTMLALGTQLPAFQLPNAVDSKPVSSQSLPAGKGTLVMFLCNHCPYVKHVRAELVKLAHEAIDQGVTVVAINSNSTQTHPQDGPEAMRELASSEHWRFPFLFDESQSVAQAFRAACTPDFFLFDGSRKLVYRGQMDDSRPSNGKPVTGRDLRAALDALISGKPPLSEQRASIGCGIKWHPGREPAYLGGAG
jgi:thiol-disulfide isomerase/thioredoxin